MSTGLPRTANTFEKGARPSGYVAGIGRGAMGFQTRSDVGGMGQTQLGNVDAEVNRQVGGGGATIPAPNFGQAPEGYVAGGGRGFGGSVYKPEPVFGEKGAGRGRGSSMAAAGAFDDSKADYSESNFDKNSGYDSKGLFDQAEYDKDDAEADNIYAAVDEHMDGRHKRKRELAMLEAQKTSGGGGRPKITDQFSDLKQGLGKLSAADWDSIPDVGDHSLKLTQNRFDKAAQFSAVPDSIMSNAASALGEANFDRSIDSTQGSGHETVVTKGMSEARGATLSTKLDRMADSVSGQTVVDPKGYMTNLNGLNVASSAEIGDIKKARMLLGSVTSSNPKHAPGWIASARVEEVAGKMVAARKIAQQGCEACPESEDVWIESARLNDSDNAKAILAAAVRKLPKSINIWIKASELEREEDRKKIVLRRALEYIPNSVKLWKMAVELEDAADARIMLARAVECVPQSVEMWLALAKLETHENARKVLNQAREALPTEPLTWITAARLEEAHGNGHMADKIVQKMLSSLSQYQVTIGREAWIADAEVAEAAGAPMTCAAIVNHTISLGVEEQDLLVTWMDDAEGCLSRKPSSVHTSRAIYEVAVKAFSSKRTLWMAYAAMEKEYGSADSMQTVLQQAVQHCPQTEVLWLMSAKEKWKAGDLEGARAVLTRSFEANPTSAQIWLAAAKLEWESNELERARALLAKARDRASCDRVWMKSALLERELAKTDTTALFGILDEAISRFADFDKLPLIAAQACLDDLKDVDRARKYVKAGLKECPRSVPLWLLSARAEEQAGGENKARSTLELARLKMPKAAKLWLEAIRLERRVGNKTIAEAIAAKAAQECPSSGLLWAENLLTCPKNEQKSKSVEALKKCDNDPLVILAVAKLFEVDRKGSKARKWFERACALQPQLGDAWAALYAFEVRQSLIQDPNKELGAGQEQLQKIVEQCVAAEPNRGEIWNSTRKRTENRRLATEEVLQKCVEVLLSEK